MRKRTKKLSLSKETLAHMDARRLEGAAGGSINPPFETDTIIPDCATRNVSCQGSCACTGTELCQTVTCTC